MDNTSVIYTTSYYYTSSQICEAENDGEKSVTGDAVLW